MSNTQLAPGKFQLALQRYFRAHPHLTAAVHIEANWEQEKMGAAGSLLLKPDPEVVKRNDDMIFRLTTSLTSILRRKPEFLPATGGFIAEATQAQVQEIAVLQDVRCVDLSGKQKP